MLLCKKTICRYFRLLMSFWYNIKQEIKDNDISCNVSKNTVYKSIENNCDISENDALKIARHLNTDTEKLMTGTDKPYRPAKSCASSKVNETLGSRVCAGDFSMHKKQMHVQNCERLIADMETLPHSVQGKIINTITECTSLHL